MDCFFYYIKYKFIKYNDSVNNYERLKKSMENPII